MERLVTVAPLRAYTSRLAVEECGDPVLHYKALRRLLREARKLSAEVAKLNPPPAVTCYMTRLIEELRSWHDADKLRAYPTKLPFPLVAPAAKHIPPPEPASPPPGLEWIDLALALLIRHKGNITAKEVAARVGVSEPTLCKNEDWQKARETYRQSRKKSEEKSDTPSEAESDDE
jgi:hypothetical protein